MRLALLIAALALLPSRAFCAGDLFYRSPEPPYIRNELKYLPILAKVIQKHWPEVKDKSLLAAQVRQETCYSLSHGKCWSPHAELKTEREYGFGLGQLTVTQKFDNFSEAKKLDKSLGEWDWGDRYNPEYQLTAMVLMVKFNYGKFSWAKNETERLAFSFSAYNGGISGVIEDRKVCAGSQGCDPSMWFGNVERTSKKAKSPVGSYKKSFFDINRDYVRHIMIGYPDRYRHFFCAEEDNDRPLGICYSDYLGYGGFGGLTNFSVTLL